MKTSVHADLPQELVAQARACVSGGFAHDLSDLLADALREYLESRALQPKRRSLAELRGLGAEIWSGVDACDYVRELRDEWDAQ